MTKLRVLHYMHAPLLGRRSITYLLWDPEVESHTYQLGNVNELSHFCANALGVSEADVRRWIDETSTDAWLTTDLRRRTRWLFDVKTQPPLGQRVLWWVIVRSQKPRLVVETGIYEGLGSLVILAALERNAAEGGPDGRLISIDNVARAGRLVPEELKRRWEKVVGFTSEVLAPAIGNRQVDVLFHDTPHTEEIQELEFGNALERAGPRLVLIDGSGGNVPTLGGLAHKHGAALRHFVPKPLNHPYSPTGVDLAVFDSDAA